MSDFLSTILEEKKREVEQRKRTISEEFLEERSASAMERRSLCRALATPGRRGINIIAEVKRGSPSRGVMNPGLDAAQFARRYESCGAAAVSVLTDAGFFHGKAGDLRSARAAVKIPVLRKDFIVSRYQIFESAVMGADAVLLIVRAISPELLGECLRLCRRIGLDALVEVHSAEELDAASEAGAVLIGMNNRDLSTFTTDIRTSIQLVRRMRPGQVAVSESGIRCREQIDRLLDAGIWNFLIGESLVTAPEPEAVLAHLFGAYAA
ncbi:indole-3-glycerol phosphate synthase TrpC [Syntrophobacter fumaroxidans]|uniref:Indole-3-glycerol phosphate synthase n=1 Tax=Syntrophobacter fumaroxidans (strain DSM 10017 / MPOB) TaxID=335543 RepID=TRPC_SYNFM|nr:indole-3-glycerol phosphate synthase TrpC [Syntrophobacter fumaroxidans]A0LJ58.1 RecName: Full=Indole-3-glycerol phosphate synthase; Short=IGPS [Syntrophobacter fumaroxidans MPOB]ABK17460.1 indole-3-glycerol phosphate synthase [Syntrophobacter fumaroxidans MPOB]